MKGKTLLLFFLLVFYNLCFSHLLETIPLDSWVYSAIDQLYTQDLFKSLHKEIRPYTRGQIASFLLEIDRLQKENQISITQSQDWLLYKLRDEFQYELKTLEAQEKIAKSWKLGLNPVLSLDSEDEKKPVRARFKSISGYQFNQKAFFVLRGIADSQGEKESTFLGRKWKGGLSGAFDQAYAHLDFGFIKLFLGRDNQRWGPGSIDGLLFSGQTPPPDQIRLEGKTGYFKFSFFTSVLEKIFVPDSNAFANRYISSHRINFKHPSGIELGVSEVVIYGGLNRQLELFYLNPILPYYVEQFNHQGLDDNILWSLDFDFTFWKNKEFYAELLIDDFQYDFKSEPHQIGYLVGSRLANLLGWQGSFLSLEYSRIRYWVYGATLSWNRFSFENVGLGSALGPDADLIKGSLLYHFSKAFSLETIFSYKRKGEGRIDIPYPQPLPDRPDFPYGVVEKIFQFGLTTTFQPNAKLRANLSLGLENIRNKNHISGQKIENDFSARLLLEYNFWRESGF